MAGKDTLYARWLSGELSEQEIRQLKESGEWTELERIANATTELTLPPMDVDAAWQKIKAAKMKQQSPIRSLWRPWLGAVATLLLLIALGTWLWSGHTRVSTAAIEKEEVRLPDGTTCLLNAGSQLAYNRNRWDHKRQVSLKGEGFFEVAEGQPFLVKTDLGHVEVLGTAFNVRARDQRLYVECYSGRVRVMAQDELIELGPQERLRVIHGVLEEVEIMQSTHPKWSLGQSIFDNEPTANVFAELERQFGFRIVGTIDLTFTGSFDHADLDRALGQVCLPLGLGYDTDIAARTVTISQ
ncbi:MAG: FecR domain-containing protein [Saprospiraceae bacterium]|nr:FecR domain-containing protein [Saprospiraceae bacterium]